MKYLKSIWNFLLKWNELITIPFGFVIWKYAPWLMRVSGFDETAGQYDSVVFMNIIFAIVAVSIFSGVSWLFLKITFPSAYHYLDETLSRNLHESNQHITKWQKSKIVLFLLGLYFLALLLALNAI